MSRHRRQASQVVPPEILTGNEPFLDLGQATAGGHSNTTGTTTVALNDETSKNNPPTTQHHQDQASAASPPNAEKPLPTGKPAEHRVR